MWLLFSVCWFFVSSCTFPVNSQDVSKLEKIVYWSFQTYDSSGGGGSGKDSSRQADDVGVDTGGGGQRELTGDLSDDNKAIMSGHGKYDGESKSKGNF
jgi:hypothetical protein